MGHWLGIFLGLCLAGCASQAGPHPASAAERARLEKLEALEAFSGRCRFEANAASAESKPSHASAASDVPPPPLGTIPEPSLSPSVFLDLAFFAVPIEWRHAAAPGDLHALAEDPRVELLAVTHHLAELGRVSRAVVGEHSGPFARPQIHELVAKPNLTEGEQVVLDLQVVLQLPWRADSSSRLREHDIVFVTAPRAQRPVALSAPLPERTGQALLLLLTPYVVDQQRDLRQIFECKMADRRRLATRRDERR